MIGRDENNEDVSFRVTDRRKFNSDGSLKEGVTIEKAPVVEPEKPETPAPAEAAAPVVAEDPKAGSVPEFQGADDIDIDADAELLGADDPASFVNFLSTLVTNAAASLGAMPHPATGQRTLDLDSGKYWLDVLAMLREKTKGNLLSQESRLLDGILADLRMQYVTAVRTTEEKLKTQAAKKFSGQDILGKK